MLALSRRWFAVIEQRCREHFDEPDPPPAEAAPGEQATLREVTRHE